MSEESRRETLAGLIGGNVNLPTMGNVVLPADVLLLVLMELWRRPPLERRQAEVTRVISQVSRLSSSDRRHILDTLIGSEALDVLAYVHPNILMNALVAYATSESTNPRMDIQRTIDELLRMGARERMEAREAERLGYGQRTHFPEGSRGEDMGSRRVLSEPRLPGLRMRFSKEDINIKDLSQLLASVNDLYKLLGTAGVVADGVKSELPLIESPIVTRLTKQSPMTMELGTAAAGGGVAVLAFRAIAAAIREPELLGSFFPKVRTGWYDARAAELKARKRLEVVRRLGGDVSVDFLDGDASSASRVQTDEDDSGDTDCDYLQ